MRIQVDSSTSYRGRNARPNWVALFVFVVVALASGAVGALFSPGVVTPGVVTPGVVTPGVAAPGVGAPGVAHDPAGRGISVSPAKPAAVSTSAWYAGLRKPAWTPPNSWFGPIWTLLYVLMGSAAWLVWSERYHPRCRAALLCYAIQLVINALWAPAFFGAQSIGAGLFLIVALWLALVWTLREFAQVRVAAAWLLVPYLVWVSLALALNLSIWRNNL
jgi:tryptophan-rich sensory protein